MDLNLLTLFVTVAETSSFSAAARKLGLPKSSVSRGVAALEAEVGTQLLHRTTRQVALSTAGAALYEKARPLLASLREAVGTLPEKEEEPAGELRITAPGDVGAIFLAGAIAAFNTRYPHVRFDVRVTNTNIDLVGDGVDLAIRAVTGRIPDSSLVKRKLSAIELQLFASPAYLARRGTPRTPEDLVSHAYVAFRSYRTPAIAAAKVQPALVGDDYFFIRSALRAGVGVGPLPTFLAKADVAAGQLVRVLPRQTEAVGEFILLYPKTQHVPRKVCAFRDFLLEYLAGHPLV